MFPNMFSLYFISILSLFPLTDQSFQIALLKQLSLVSFHNNIVFSPLSIYQILSLASNGAKGNTQIELLKVLHQNNIVALNQCNINYLNKQSKQSLFIANALFSKFHPIEHFIEIAKKYKATASKLISVTQVNEWCASNTNKKITSIINDITDIDLLLINAINFK